MQTLLGLNRIYKMCTGLESADILGGTIGYAAFEECESIKSVMIGDIHRRICFCRLQ